MTGSDRARRPTVEVAHEALIRTWPRLRGWIDANREKLRARAAVLQAKADWEQNDRRDDMLLPAGLQLERARSLLADPGDITTDDIKEFISLSSARESRTPLALACVFALASFPIVLQFPSFWGVMLTVVSGLALVRWRRAEITGTEIALYWLGLSLVAMFAMGPLVLSWFGRPTDSALISGGLAGVMLTVVSGLALVRWRRAEITDTEIALYWLGLSLAVAFAMGPLVNVAISTNDWVFKFAAGWIAGAILLVVSALAWVRWRGAEIIRTEIALCSLGLSLVVPFAMVMLLRILSDTIPANGGWIAGATLVSALAWVRWRWAEIKRTEIALCWLGLSLVVPFAMVRPIITPVGKGWVDEGWTLMVVSALAWVLWRRAEITGTDSALYWPGLSLVVTFAMAVFGSTLNGYLNFNSPYQDVFHLLRESWFHGAMTAAIIGMILLTLWRRRSAA